MTTQPDAIRELIAKIEAGERFPWDDAIAIIGVRIGWAVSAYDGSLDAALALHEALLPDAWVDLRKAGKYGHCTVDLDGEEYDANNQPTPARAWLLAILKAHLAEMEQ